MYFFQKLKNILVFKLIITPLEIIKQIYKDYKSTKRISDATVGACKACKTCIFLKLYKKKLSQHN